MKNRIILIFAIFVAICCPTNPATAADPPYRIVTGQAALTTTAAQIIATDTQSRVILIENLDATITIYVGPAGVTAATGKRILAGRVLPLTTRAAIFAVAASGTPSVDWSIER